MKFLKVLIPVVLVLALGACAKPPQADIDAAKAAVAAAEQNAEVTAYAPDTLKSAQDKLAQMDAELTAKHYDKVKTLALEAKAAAETAAVDAAKNKDQVKADAEALIDSLKKALPDASKKVAAAKKIKSLKATVKTFSKELADAKAAIADAQKDLEAGAYAAAKEKAVAVQAKLEEGQKALADAVEAAKGKK